MEKIKVKTETDKNKYKLSSEIAFNKPFEMAK